MNEWKEHTISALALRRELIARALTYSDSKSFEMGYAPIPAVLFNPSEARHGNFHPESYLAIRSNIGWLKRLEKAYTGGKWIPRRWDRTRAELDCATSSDALLMNIFCYPEIYGSARFRALLGIDPYAQPEFGFKPGIPLRNGRTDRTEIDMRLGRLLVEAKLTESSFQTAPLDRVMLYNDVEEVFDVDELPRLVGGTMERVDSYQLIRGVLAAWHTGHTDRSFVVLCDARRRDLIERWFLILRAVRSATLRPNLALLTWQELAATAPRELQHFLEQKYGIFAKS